MSLEKLKLNDASFAYEPETSAALGFGFRCGFLGFLHAEIVQERLEREYGLDLIATAPTVRYRVVPKGGEPAFEIESPASLPDERERARRLSWRYVDMPTHCTWDQRSRTWRLRERAAKHGDVVTRLFAVKPNPRNLEPYHLRLLLLHVPGAQARCWRGRW